MAYNENLANRIREKLADLPNIEEKKMMGGLVFMYNGKMCVGIFKDELMCRVDKNIHAELVEKNGCRTMDFSNRPMIGYILVREIAMKSNKDFDAWIQLSLDYNKFAKAAKKKNLDK